MLKRNLWKLVLSFTIVLWALLSLTPLTDRDVPTYIAGEVETRNAEFHAFSQFISQLPELFFDRCDRPTTAFGHFFQRNFFAVTPFDKLTHGSAQSSKAVLQLFEPQFK